MNTVFFLFTGKVVPVILLEFTGITVKGLQLQFQLLEIQLSYAYRSSFIKNLTKKNSSVAHKDSICFFVEMQ